MNIDVSRYDRYLYCCSAPLGTCSNGDDCTFSVSFSYPKGEISQLIEIEEAQGKTGC